jgi:predicted cupin superfamily sugar epimerase
MRPDAGYWIKELALTRHVEGGSFRETYRSGLSIGKEHLPPGFKGKRNFSTSIYFLLEQGQFSAFHRIPSDELWHFYYGDTLIIYEIDGNGTLHEHLLGNDPRKGESFQVVIRAGNWFGSRPAAGSEYALVGCTVSPGFDFEDFELAERERLCEDFPQHAGLITALTY